MLTPPKLFYDCLLYFYLTGAFVAFFATLYIGAWYWILPHSLLLLTACLHLAFAVGGRQSNTVNSILSCPAGLTSRHT